MLDKNILLVATPKELEQWLVSYRMSKHPNDEPGVWSTFGSVSYHIPELGAVTFEIKAPEPGKLFIVSIDYNKIEQSELYINELIEKIINKFGDLSLPNGFSIVVSSDKVAELLEDRWAESVKTQKTEAHLATMVLLGSILEGMLLDTVKSNKEKANKAKAAPRNKDKKTGKLVVSPLERWGLENLIDVCRECKWLSNHIFYDTKAVRKYRNLVHPNEQLELDLYPDDAMCDIARTIVNSALKDLKRYVKDGEIPRG